MDRCKSFMLVLVLNFKINAASPLTKSDQYQTVVRVAKLMEALEKIDRRISLTGKEVREDFSRFRMKVAGRVVHSKTIND